MTDGVEYPKPLHGDALHGLAGDFVRMVEPGTEADPPALLFQFLAAFGNLIGKGPHFRIGATIHHTNLFTAIVGNTASARKGTSWDLVKRVLDPVDPFWAKSCRISGLGSGEALIAAVRDAGEVEPGIPTPRARDKRALVDEGELAKILKVSQREGSTLSAVLRSAWDGGDLQNRVKDQANCLISTRPHVSIVAHCTREELLKLISGTDISNGSVNRYAWVCSKRSKLVPLPVLPAETELTLLIDQLKAVASFAKTQGEMPFTTDAAELWNSIYPDLSRERLGIQGALAARAAPMVIRLAMIFALLDNDKEIGVIPLRAAMAAWKYVEASVGYIFGQSTGDKAADKLLTALGYSSGGLTKTEIIENVFNRNVKVESVDRLLKYLVTAGYISKRQDTSSSGRQVDRWVLKRSNENSSNSSLVAVYQEGSQQ